MPKRNPFEEFNTSRRTLLISSAVMAAATGLPMAAWAAKPKPASTSVSHGSNRGGHHMSTITTKDGTSIYYKD